MPAETADCGAVSGAADALGAADATRHATAGGSSTQAEVFVQSAQMVGVPPVVHFIVEVPVPSVL